MELSHQVHRKKKGQTRPYHNGRRGNVGRLVIQGKPWFILFQAQMEKSRAQGWKIKLLEEFRCKGGGGFGRREYLFGER